MPAEVSATVNSLQSEAVRRADAMNLQIPLREKELVTRADTSHGPMLFGDDTLQDCLNLRQPVVWFENLQVSVPLPATDSILTIQDTPTDETADLVYVRWITPGKVLDFAKLSDIATDTSPLPKNTTIEALKQIALERVFKNGSESPTVADLNVELFLSPCALSTTHKPMTLENLGRVGRIDNPLDLFVVPRQTSLLGNEEKPHLSWGFKTSQQGIATFSTCLKVSDPNLSDDSNLHDF